MNLFIGYLSLGLGPAKGLGVQIWHKRLPKVSLNIILSLAQLFILCLSFDVDRTTHFYHNEILRHCPRTCRARSQRLGSDRQYPVSNYKSALPTGLLTKMQV